MWEEYVTKALSLKNTFPDYLEIKYEDFLERPFDNLQKLALFSGLQPSEQQLQNEISTIKSERAFAFLNNKNYVEHYQQIKTKPLMQQLGYDNL